MNKSNIKSVKYPHIALLIMMKNEEQQLHISLESIIGYVDSIIAYDTGSTDNTLQILKDFTEKHKIPLRLKQGKFVNFSVSRNISLDFADSFTDIDFLLLLDVNDELKGGEKLRKFALEQIKTENSAYLMCQHWWSGRYDKYFNIRFIKPRKGWRYKGSVHEFMFNIKEKRSLYRMSDDIILYQDRTKDNKSVKRFSTDKVLLLEDYKKDPTDTRVIFYLAQTCICLNQLEDAFNYYKLRSELDGFQEEKFHSYLNCGKISEKLNHDWHVSLSYYMKAVEHSERVEPLIKLAEHYYRVKKWNLAYMFSHLACSLKYPEKSILFVDKTAYDYTRWHIMGIVAYYYGKYEEGKIACQKAIKAGLNIELDKSNFEFYKRKEI